MAVNEDAEKRQAKADVQVNLDKRKEYGAAYGAALNLPTTSSSFKEPSGNLLDNPPFIFPGPLTTIAVTGEQYKPKRGYIRRLNEFYSRMGPEAKSITGRRCNFQFQPETIVRSVSAQSTDTQFFFNQDPAQLSVPIPGQSNYNIVLMFNREAEVASGKYTNNFGKMMKSKNLINRDSELDVNKFITGDYQQEWVCSIGVLADIMVLDGVIGQGISTETIKILNTISSTQAATTATDSTATEEQKKQAQDILEKESQKVKYWTQDAATNPNLGNTAFLVPTPVRIMLSNMMMVEGFILTSSVNFHKFSKHYIPTQCRVDLTVQALYIGFAKNQTLLTQDTPLSLTSGGSGPDEVTVKEKDANILKTTQEGINTFFNTLTAFDVSGTLSTLKSSIFTNTTGNFLGKFLTSITDAGETFYDEYTSANGGEVTWFWEAKIKLSWNTVAAGSVNQRQTGVFNKPAGSTLRNVTSSDFAANGELADLTAWGTTSNPLIIESSGGIHKKIKNFGRQDRWFVSDASGPDTDATWIFTAPTSPTYKRPFNEETFKLEFELTISAKRYGSDYVSSQKFKNNQIVRADGSFLTNELKATI